MPRAHRVYSLPITAVRLVMLRRWWRTLADATLRSSRPHNRGSGRPANGRFQPRLVLLEERCLPSATLTVDPPLNISRLSGNQVCTAVAVDPSNPQRLFAAANAGTGS